MFLVIDENMRLCLYMMPQDNMLWMYNAGSLRTAPTLDTYLSVLLYLLTITLLQYSYFKDSYLLHIESMLQCSTNT